MTKKNLRRVACLVVVGALITAMMFATPVFGDIVTGRIELRAQLKPNFNNSTRYEIFVKGTYLGHPMTLYRLPDAKPGTIEYYDTFLLFTTEGSEAAKVEMEFLNNLKGSSDKEKVVKIDKLIHEKIKYKAGDLTLSANDL